MMTLSMIEYVDWVLALNNDGEEIETIMVIKNDVSVIR